MLPQLLIAAWFSIPLLAYAINMALPRRVPAALLFLPIVFILCVPGFYQTYSIGVRSGEYQSKMEGLVKKLDQDSDGRILDAEITPEYVTAMREQPPINCVMPLEFVYVPASFMWCGVCFLGMYAFEKMLCVAQHRSADYD